MALITPGNGVISASLDLLYNSPIVNRLAYKILLNSGFTFFRILLLAIMLPAYNWLNFIITGTTIINSNFYLRRKYSVVLVLFPLATGMTEQNENTEKGFTRTLTVRNMPIDVDIEITEQARVTSKSKSDFVKEFLSASFRDLIGNFMRGNGLSDYWYDSALTLAEKRAWCRLLGIYKEEALQHIMRNGVPLLELRAAQLPDITHIPHGISLAFSLFIEAARRNLPTVTAPRRKRRGFLPLRLQLA